MSKTYSSCGLRIGFLISKNEALMEKVERLGQARLGPQPAGQLAAVAGLQLGEAYAKPDQAAGVEEMPPLVRKKSAGWGCGDAKTQPKPPRPSIVNESSPAAFGCNGLPW